MGKAICSLNVTAPDYRSELGLCDSLNVLNDGLYNYCVGAGASLVAVHDTPVQLQVYISDTRYDLKRFVCVLLINEQIISDLQGVSVSPRQLKQTRAEYPYAVNVLCKRKVLICLG